MQKIAPCLWFDRTCEEAVNSYLGVFPNSKVTTLKRYPADMQVGPMKDMAGQVLTAIFELNGFHFQALDGGPMFTINPWHDPQATWKPNWSATAATPRRGVSCTRSP